MAPKYPCGMCNTGCRGDIVECSECNMWIHRRCVPVTVAMLGVWGGKGLRFVCPRCLFLDTPKPRKTSVYDIKGALQR